MSEQRSCHCNECPYCRKWMLGEISALQASLLTTQSERDQARKELEKAQGVVVKYMEGMINAANQIDTTIGSLREQEKIATSWMDRAQAAEQQVRSLQAQVEAKDKIFAEINKYSTEGFVRKLAEAALSPRRES